jgi:hypothetical protein
MKWSRWTPEEINCLRDNYTTMPAGELAKTLHRTPGSVYVKAHELGMAAVQNKARPYDLTDLTGLRHEADPTDYHNLLISLHHGDDNANRWLDCVARLFYAD